MKTLPIPRLLLVLCSIVVPLLASRVEAANAPVWTLTVPAATFASDSSTLASISTDAAGNAFVVITHMMAGAGIPPTPTPAGVQLFLLNPKGKILASGDFSNLPGLIPVQVTGRRVLALTSSLEQFSIGPEQTFVRTVVPLATSTEIALPFTGISLDRKFLHTSTTTASKVTEVRCYTLTKLKP